MVVFPGLHQGFGCQGLPTRGHVGEARSKGGAKPLVATGDVEIAAERIEIDRLLEHRVRTIDANRYAMLFGELNDGVDWKGDGGRRGDVAEDDQLGSRRDLGGDRIDDLR